MKAIKLVLTFVIMLGGLLGALYLFTNTDGGTLPPLPDTTYQTFRQQLEQEWEQAGDSGTSTSSKTTWTHPKSNDRDLEQKKINPNSTSSKTTGTHSKSNDKDSNKKIYIQRKKER